MTFFFNVTDTGEKGNMRRSMFRCMLRCTPRRFMAANWPVDIALLHHLAAPRLFCWHSVRRGGFDARHDSEISRREIEGARAVGCHPAPALQ